MPDLLYVSDVSPYQTTVRDGNAAGTTGPTAVAGVHPSVNPAATVLAEIAGLCGLKFRHASQAVDITPADLAAARILALFTIGETPWSSAQRTVIERRTADGSLGIVGLHSATDSSYGWAAMGELLGARFNGHPVTGDFSITVVDPGHPATAHLNSPWHWHDELYLFRELVPEARILLAVDFGSVGGEQLPLAWCIERPPARAFYTALGHFVTAYHDADYLQHVRGGIEWVLGA